MRHYFGAVRLKGKGLRLFSPVHAPREQGASERPAGEKGKTKTRGNCLGLCFGSPCWARTSDTLINSQVLVPTELRRNINQGKLIQFPLVCVGYELFSRAVASQVSSPLQRLTSVFGMGTGGPTALK